MMRRHEKEVLMMSRERERADAIIAASKAELMRCRIRTEEVLSDAAQMVIQAEGRCINAAEAFRGASSREPERPREHPTQQTSGLVPEGEGVRVVKNELKEVSPVKAPQKPQSKSNGGHIEIRGCGGALEGSLETPELSSNFEPNPNPNPKPNPNPNPSTDPDPHGKVRESKWMASTRVLTASVFVSSQMAPSTVSIRNSCITYRTVTPIGSQIQSRTYR